MENFVYTVRGCMNEEDAIAFLVSIIEDEYSDIIANNIRINGFRRVFAQTDGDIIKRLKTMNASSPCEFAFSGFEGTAKIYTFWGKVEKAIRGNKREIE